MQPQHTDETPIPLLLAAAAVPATAVPCPPTSLVLELLSYMFQPGTSFDARSSCVASTPVSRMAITTLFEPVVMVHAAGAWILFRWPSQLTNHGSFGVTS